MMGPYTAEQRRELDRRLATSDTPRCPECEATLDVQPVQQPPEVSYVRQRAWVFCAGCRRTTAVDMPPRHRG
jgi:uncharacterized protein with PIN domain